MPVDKDTMIEAIDVNKEYRRSGGRSGERQVI